MWSFKWSKADRLGLSLYILNSIKPLKLELLWNSYSIFTYQGTRQNEYRNNENPNLIASKDNSKCRKCCLWQILSSWSNIGLSLYPNKISFIFRHNPATFQAFNWEKMTKFFHSWLKKTKSCFTVSENRDYLVRWWERRVIHNQVCFYSSGTIRFAFTLLVPNSKWIRMMNFSSIDNRSKMKLMIL